MSEKTQYEQVMERMRSDINHIVDEAYAKGFKMGEQVGSAEAGAMDYQKGIEDMHEAIKKIANMSAEDKDAVFDSQTLYYIVNNYTANEIMKKLATYEQRKKADPEIKVGDEIAFHNEDRPDTVVVVTRVGENGFVDGMDGKGTLYAEKNPMNWTKTGRHFPEVAELLKKMKGGAE